MPTPAWTTATARSSSTRAAPRAATCTATTSPRARRPSCAGSSSPGHDESSPTVDAGRVAAIRDSRTAYWRPLGAQGKSVRLRTPGAGLRTLRLRGGRVVGIDDRPADRFYEAVVWTSTLKRSKPLQVGGIGVEGEAVKYISDAQIAQGGIRWVQQGSEFGGFEGYRGSRFDGTGRRTARRPASTYSAAFFGTKVLFVRTTLADGYDQLTRCPKAGCEVQTAPAPFR